MNLICILWRNMIECRLILQSVALLSILLGGNEKLYILVSIKHFTTTRILFVCKTLFKGWDPIGKSMNISLVCKMFSRIYIETIQHQSSYLFFQTEWFLLFNKNRCHRKPFLPRYWKRFDTPRILEREKTTGSRSNVTPKYMSVQDCEKSSLTFRRWIGIRYRSSPINSTINLITKQFRASAILCTHPKISLNIFNHLRSRS